MRSRGTRRSLLTLGFLFVVLVWVSVAAAQLPMPPATQFDITGFIQAATLDPGCLATDETCGGTITVNNQIITVPKYTILQMPAAALTWQEVFAYAPPPYGIPGNPGVTSAVPTTGLALSDTISVGVPAPLGTYEAHVVGNRVGNTYIAGLMFLAQHSLQSGQGFINFIDLTTGEFRVGGVLNDSTTGARVKVNDPLGKFGRAWTPDRRFTIDENNPTVRSETGYPLCIPRTVADDPACPQKNRATFPPNGVQYTFPTSAQSDADPALPDPRLMAPFQVGDYVTYSGILVADPAPLTTTYIAAWTVIGNVGLFTAPGDEPAYVATDVMLLGVGGLTVVGATEASVRTRFEGFTTDPSRKIYLWGVDVDPTTGAQTARSWGSIDVDQGPPGGAVKGRWRFRPPTKVLTLPDNTALCPAPGPGCFLPATREMRVVRGTCDPVLSTCPFDPNNPLTTGGIADTGDLLPSVGPNGGLLAGLYQAPIFEFIFPENAGTGLPIVPNNFEAMPFLANGSGPWETSNGPCIKQLTPWPGAAAPTPVGTCGVAVSVPIANAGSEQFVASAAPVTLTGTATNGTPPYVSFVWTQIGGPAVVLTQDALTGVATFTAPTVLAGSPPTVVTFNLVVTDSLGAVSAPASVWVTVSAVADTVNILSVEYRTNKTRLIVQATSSLQPPFVANPPVALTMQPFDSTGKAMTSPQPMTWDPTLNLYSVTQLGGQPTSVKVLSNYGGSQTSGITRLR
jgi:K319-like protein